MRMELPLSESKVEPGYSVGYAPAAEKASVMYVSGIRMVGIAK